MRGRLARAARAVFPRLFASTQSGGRTSHGRLVLSRGVKTCLALACLLALVASCGESRERHNVLLVTLDTTRFNAPGFMGNKERPTPNLDALAAESLVYEQARTVTPLTMPAHCSMLTGLYPPRHTISANGARPLPSAARTLAEYAQAEGVQTGAFVASIVLDRSFGLAQGFDTYVGVEPPQDKAAPRIAELKASEVLGRARAWLDARDRSHPFLAWVHLFDAHDPYEPPPEFSGMRSAYLGEVAYMDRELGKLFEALRADGTLERTLVIVLGDHGEGLNQHSEVTHGWFCYDSTVRVPMLVRFPDGWRKGERSKESVSVVDVFPTALSALGLEAPRDIDGANLDHALVPDARGVYFECFNGAENFGWSPLVGWADARAKYIHSSAPELFDLEQDRQEQRNVLAERSADAARMLAEIRRVRSGPALVRDRDESVNPEAQRALRGLGYVDSGQDSGARLDPLAPGNLPAPGQRKEELKLFQTASDHSARGELTQAIAQWQDLLARFPENHTARSLCAADLIRAQRPAEALPLLEALRSTRSLTANEWNNLGWCREQAADRTGASECYAKALELDPAHPWATDNLARVRER
jgi:choline-sulfatase